VFSAAQRRAIVARDRTCIWSGCDAPAGWCDVHHIIHWVDGGVTSVENSVLLCGRHHDRIHAYSHKISAEADADGHYRVSYFRLYDPRWTGHPHRAGP
jgi:HNH endonuclease